MEQVRISEEAAALLLDRERRISVVATGAGAGLQRALWDVPGVSKVLHSAEFPYSMESLDRYLGYSPARYCSEETAVEMAMEAYRRAWSPGVQTIGLSVSASVASKEEHRGDHRAYVAVMTDDDCFVHHFVLDKGSGREARERDGAIVDYVSLAALFSASGVDWRPSFPYPVKSWSGHGAMGMCRTLLEERPLFLAGKRLRSAPHGAVTIFPGAFNPPHPGHLWLGDTHGAIYHVCTKPPHKDALSPVDVLRRAKMLDGRDVLFSPKDPLYIDKARSIPGCRIVIGADAFVRMLDPKWGVPVDPMLQEFFSLGTQFLVADRLYDGRLVTLEDVQHPLPPGLCVRVKTPEQFVDMSSTALRAAVSA